MAWAENFEISTSGSQNQRSTSELHPDMELLPRIELEPVAYETTVQPLNYSSMEADVRLELNVCGLQSRNFTS